jgi:hypothetical protein
MTDDVALATAALPALGRRNHANATATLRAMAEEAASGRRRGAA